MASRKKLFRPKRQSTPPDELGGFADGGLAILDAEGQPIQVTRSKVASALRYFVARVELHSNESLPARLALTSALAGEGVTFISRALGSIIAYDTVSSVVVVDVNWRRPSADGDTPTQPGLADAVEKGTSLDEIIQPTANTRLSMVSAGEVAVARRPALAGSTALGDVLDELESRFDHLLLDLPPVLATSEAMNISLLADSYALVVRQGVTTIGQVEAALEEMQALTALGVILNRFHSDVPARLRRVIGA